MASGDTLLTLGDSVWASDDGGRSWSQSATQGAEFWQVAEQNGVLLTAGSVGRHDPEDTGRYVSMSFDDGNTWRNYELPRISPTSYPKAATFGPAGEIVVLGWNAQANTLVVWTSTDGGQTWHGTDTESRGRVSDVVAVPGGYVAVGEFQGAGHEDQSRFWASTNASVWTGGAIDFHEARNVRWGPTFGVLVSGGITNPDLTHQAFLAIGANPFSLTNP